VYVVRLTVVFWLLWRLLLRCLPSSSLGFLSILVNIFVPNMRVVCDMNSQTFWVILGVRLVEGCNLRQFINQFPGLIVNPRCRLLSFYSKLCSYLIFSLANVPKFWLHFRFFLACVILGKWAFNEELNLFKVDCHISF
jgi:hypothetical protein